MKKTLITLAALAMASVASADSLGEWNFEDNLNKTGEAGLNGTDKNGITYVDSLDAGTTLGDYQTSADLGKAVQVTGNTDGTSSWVGLYGTDYYVQNIRPNKSFTLSAYVNFNASDGDFISILGTGQGVSTGMAIGIYRNSDDTYSLDVLTKYVAHNTTSTLAALTEGEWHHIAVSYTSTGDTKGTATWYLNGGKVGTSTVNGWNAPTGYEGSALGASTSDSSTSFTGSLTMDKVQVFNEALGQDAILANAGLVAISTPPTGDAIPEPATATLSLLALAGLAARRRRK